MRLMRFLASVLLMLLSLPAAGYYIQSMDVSIKLNRSSSFDVVERIAVDFIDLEARDACVIFEKVEREGFDVFPALPQGRHLNGDDGNAVKQVFAEATFFEQVFQWLTASGDETNVFSGEQVAAEAFGG